MADRQTRQRRPAARGAERDNRNLGMAAAGVAGALGLAWLATKLWKKYEEEDRPAAALSGDRAPGWSGQGGGGHGSAGPDSMRDPPKTWSKTDQAVDESFPASDPAPFKPHID